MGVVVEGEETSFETVYCGNSYRFVESRLAPDCCYQLRCRLLLADSASMATPGPCPCLYWRELDPAVQRQAHGQSQYAWSDPVDFRTDMGVPFAFDTSRRGSRSSSPRTVCPPPMPVTTAGAPPSPIAASPRA